MAADTSQQGVAAPTGGDYLLEHMVRAADEEDLKLGVTLYVGGTIITGLLVSGDAYLEGCAERFAEAEGKEQAKQSLVDFMQRTKRGQPDGTAGGDEVTAHTGYIHLAEARAVSADGHVHPGVWWRGRIDRIDAFHFGMLREARFDDPRIL